MRRAQLPPHSNLPLSTSVVVRWGASTLAVERLEPLRPRDWLDGRVAIEMDERGAWARCGAEIRPIERGDRFTLRGEGVALDVDARPDEVQAWAPEVDGRKAGAHLVSLGVHASLLAVLFVLRPAVTETETVDLALLRESLLADAAVVVAEGDAPSEGAKGDAKSDAASSTGPGSSLEASPGRPTAVQAGATARGTKSASPNDRADPSTFGIISVLSAAHDHGPGEVDPWVGAGIDAGPSWGQAWGTGDGLGGLGLSGIGEGGGSHSEGIPLGGLGFGAAGAGASCDAECIANGLGRGGGMGHAPTPPRIRLCGGAPPEGKPHPCIQTAGRLPPQVIQRIVRQNFGRFRACYEDALRMQPSLVTRVSVSFVIGRDGGVSSVSGSGDDPKLAKCVTRSFYGLSFPMPDGGVVKVTYPITFSPGE